MVPRDSEKHQGDYPMFALDASNRLFAAAFSVVPIVIMGIYLTIAKRMGAFDAL